MIPGISSNPEGRDMRPFLALVILLGCFVAAPAAHAQQVVNCTPEAEADINEALSFVTDRLTSTVTRLDSLTDRQKNIFLVKWPKLKAVCRDAERRCRRSPDAKRHEMGSMTNRVRLCYAETIALYEEAEEREPTVCDLVETVVHEFGHASGFSVQRGHKGLTGDDQADDPVYAMGLAARQHCLDVSQRSDDPFSNRLLRGQSKGEIGQSCRRDGACASGKCEGQICVCRKDSQCSEGQQCRTPLIGKNYCE